MENNFTANIDDIEIVGFIKNRPSLEVEEIEQPDGTFLPGKARWLSSEATLKINENNNSRIVDVILAGKIGIAKTYFDNEEWTFKEFKINKMNFDIENGLINIVWRFTSTEYKLI